MGDFFFGLPPTRQQALNGHVLKEPTDEQAWARPLETQQEAESWT